jgi:hypothetical protein
MTHFLILETHQTPMSVMKGGLEGLKSKNSGNDDCRYVDTTIINIPGFNTE